MHPRANPMPAEYPGVADRAPTPRERIRQPSRWCADTTGHGGPMQNAPLSNGLPPSSPASSGDVVVETTRPRQTQRPSSPFRDVLANGTAILVRGAEMATSVAAGPALAAAVRETGMAAAGAIAGGAARPPGTLASAGAGTVAGAASPAGAGTTTGEPSDLLAAGREQSGVA